MSMLPASVCRLPPPSVILPPAVSILPAFVLNVVPSYVKLASAFRTPALLLPVITLLSALLLIVAAPEVPLEPELPLVPLEPELPLVPLEPDFPEEPEEPDVPA